MGSRRTLCRPLSHVPPRRRPNLCKSATASSGSSAAAAWGASSPQSTCSWAGVWPSRCSRLARTSKTSCCFRQEARAAGSLNHPNVLTVFDLGASEVGPYIVSELVEGRTLRAALGESPLPLAEAIEWARQLAEGLAAAHGKGIVHRDLKPENLFLTSDGRLKILDWYDRYLGPVR